VTQQFAEGRKYNVKENIQLKMMPSKLPHTAGTGCSTGEGKAWSLTSGSNLTNWLFSKEHKANYLDKE